MALGGVSPDDLDDCPDLTCDIPDPTAPGWKMGTDSSGCAIWIPPPGALGCGPPPPPPPLPEAAPPCAPVSVAGYTPATTMTPPSAPTQSCALADLEAFYDACIAQGLVSPDCLAFESDGGACAKCILSPESASSWGPVVVRNSIPTLNVAGCMALVQQDASPTSCAKRASDEQGCEQLACDSVCPFTVDAGELAYQQCTELAAATECRSYVDAECNAADAGVQVCVPSSLDKTTFAAMASLFCGGT